MVADLYDDSPLIVWDDGDFTVAYPDDEDVDVFAATLERDADEPLIMTGRTAAG
jgi:hypothetical protein